MTYTQKAIERANKSGWHDGHTKGVFYDSKHGVYELLSAHGSLLINLSSAVMDPLFWQALGKSEGKSEYATCISCGRLDCDHVDGYKVWWLLTWHRFIDHLAEGGDAESFLKDLLAK